MRYAKFNTREEAELKRPVLQAYHDKRDFPGPHIVDCVVSVYDGTFALTLQEDDSIDLGGEVVESLEPPVVEGGI